MYFQYMNGRGTAWYQIARFREFREVSEYLSAVLVETGERLLEHYEIESIRLEVLLRGVKSLPRNGS